MKSKHTPPLLCLCFPTTEVGQSCWVIGWAAWLRLHSAREGHRWGFLSQLCCGVNEPSSFLWLLGASVSLSLRWVNMFFSVLHIWSSIYSLIAYFFNIKSGTEGKYNHLSQISSLPACLVRDMRAIETSRNTFFRVVWEASCNSNHKGDTFLFTPYYTHLLYPVKIR